MLLLLYITGWGVGGRFPDRIVGKAKAKMKFFRGSAFIEEGFSLTTVGLLGRTEVYYQGGFIIGSGRGFIIGSAG